MSIYRLTGTAEPVSSRTGVSTPREGETVGKPWEMRSQNIRVNDFVVTSVDLADDQPGYRIGEAVDLIVDVSVRKGFLSTAVRGDWPKTAAHSLAPAPVLSKTG
jgi:hypothetical protein